MATEASFRGGSDLTKLGPTRGVMQHVPWRQAIRRLRRLFYWHTEGFLYSFDLRNASRCPSDLPKPQIDNVSDLEKFAPPFWRSRRKFLDAAMVRLQRGEHVYTFAEAGRLLHYGWVATPMTESRPTEIRQPIAFDAPVAVLYDFYTHPAARGRQLYQRCLAAILDDLSAAGGVQQAIAFAVSDNAATRRALAKVGFERSRTYHCRSVLGLTWSWTTAVAADHD
jgi:GNAT superfamily N-acetyltransferase